MSSEPAIHIAIRVNDPTPAVFSTALSEEEHGRLSEWIMSHGDLADLVERAQTLSEAEQDEAEQID